MGSVYQFDPTTGEVLRRAGWEIVDAPPGLTLAALRAAGAPFKGTRYFDRHAAATREPPVVGGAVAYRQGLLPATIGRTYTEAERLVASLGAQLPGGVLAVIGPAALYIWLLMEHHRRRGEWLLRGAYTWAADIVDLAGGGEVHLAVGVFGEQRPLVVTPVPEGFGAGIGAMPLVLPAALGPSRT
jgi:hypothetical protein